MNYRDIITMAAEMRLGNTDVQESLARGVVNGIFHARALPAPDCDYIHVRGQSSFDIVFPDGVIDLDVVRGRMSQAFAAVIWEKRWHDYPPVAKLGDIYDAALAVGRATA